MNLNVISISLSISLVCVNCARSPKTFSVPKSLSIPASWENVTGAKGENDLWWQSFMSEELRAMLEESFSGNPNLMMMNARLESAKARASIAGADLRPALSAAFQATRRKQNFIGFPIPGSASDVLSTQVSTYGFSLSSTWELDLWGRIRAGRQASIAESEASLADLEMGQLSLAAQVSKAWVRAVAAHLQLDLAKSSAMSFEETSRKIRERYEAGLRPLLDWQLAMNSAFSARALVSERRREALQSLQLLEILLGRYPSGKLKLSEDLPALSGKMLVGIPSEILHRRPDLIAAERRLAAADHRIWQSRAAFFPQIGLTTSIGTSSPELERVLDPDLNVWNLAGNLAQPIFHGGRIRAGIDLSKARAKEAMAHYLGVILNAFGEVEFALASEGDLAEREEKISAAATYSESALTLSQRRYESGLGELIEVLESQRRSLSDATLVISVRQARLNNRIDLFLALGGGVEKEIR